MERIHNWLRKKDPSSDAFPETQLNEEKSFIENGGKLLEELITSCNGKCNPIRNFSAQQIQKATNNFTSLCYSNDFNWYKGVLDNGDQVLIKRFIKEPYANTFKKPFTGPYSDIVISSLMSSHGNVLKLLGCCLEYPTPLLVYENSETGPLNHYGGIGSNGSSLSWKIRLRIANEIANSVAYLHMGFSRPIIHMNICTENVFLDGNFVAKLSNFYCSLWIPEDESFAVTRRVRLLPAFFDGASVAEGNVNEQSDVFCFGVVLLVLLTGRSANFGDDDGKYISHSVKDLDGEGRFHEIVDTKIWEELGGLGSVGEEQLQQLEDFLKLALRCIEDVRDNRPLMIEVSKELRRIARSV